MGRRGPPRKPTALKKLMGNPGRRPLPTHEPKVEAAIPDCPAHLDELAVYEWERISRELEPLGLLTRLDRAALAMYCASWSDWVRYSEKVRETAAVVKSPSGYPILNPYVSLADRAFERMQRTLRGLGLTPGDRASLHVEVPGSKEPTDFDMWLAGKRRRATENDDES
jgi:P27 family predicted phage terminase small subunit